MRVRILGSVLAAVFSAAVALGALSGASLGSGDPGAGPADTGWSNVKAGPSTDTGWTVDPRGATA